MSTHWMIAVFALGVALGLFYFAGLWFTVRRLTVSRHPELLVLSSFGVRISIVLLSFYTVSQGRWEPIVACMTGFLIARTLLVRRHGELAQLASESTAVTATGRKR